MTALTPPSSGAAAPGNKKGTSPAKTTKAAAASTSPVLARIGDQVITMKDLEDQITQYPDMARAQFQTPVAKKNMLDRIVQERVWLRAASLAGFDKKPDIVNQLRQQTNSIILRGFFNQEVVEKSKADSAEVTAYYASHPADYTTPERISWRHIILATQKDATAARDAIVKGTDFEKVAKERSTDPVSKDSGGWLGYLTRGGTPPDSAAAFPILVDSAFALPAKAVSTPSHVENGWHLLRVDSHDTTAVRPLDAVRGSIEFKLGNDKSQARYNALLDSLKTAFGVKVLADSAVFESLGAGMGAKTAEDLFKLAQDTSDPKQRIVMYERVVKEFSVSDLAAQAQFMIGFVNSEEMHDYDQAEMAFKRMKDKYPKSDLVDDADWMLRNMRNQSAPDSIGAGGEEGEEGAGKKP